VEPIDRFYLALEPDLNSIFSSDNDPTRAFVRDSRPNAAPQERASNKKTKFLLPRAYPPRIPHAPTTLLRTYPPDPKAACPLIDRASSPTARSLDAAPCPTAPRGNTPIVGRAARPSQTAVPLAPSSSIRPSPITIAHAVDPVMAAGAKDENGRTRSKNSSTVFYFYI